MVVREMGGVDVLHLAACMLMEASLFPVISAFNLYSIIFIQHQPNHAVLHECITSTTHVTSRRLAMFLPGDVTPDEISVQTQMVSP